MLLQNYSANMFIAFILAPCNFPGKIWDLCGMENLPDLIPPLPIVRICMIFCHDRLPHPHPHTLKTILPLNHQLLCDLVLAAPLA